MNKPFMSVYTNASFMRINIGAMLYKWWTKHLAIVSNWFMMGKLFHFQMVVSLFVKYKSCTYKHIFQDRLIYYDQTIYNYVNKCFTDDEFCKNN